MRGGVAGRPICVAEGAGDLPLLRRDFAFSTRVKVGSGSLGDVVGDKERDGGSFALIRSGEGGGRVVGVEGIGSHSRWNRRKDRRKAVKRESPKGRFSSEDSLNCASVAVAIQRGNALAIQAGYSRAVMRASRGWCRAA